MKKICFVTASRAEYGLLRWIMQEVRNSELFELQIVATGGHLLPEQGYTVDRIEEDGFRVNAKVDVGLDISSTEAIASSMGRMAEHFAEEFESMAPDYIAVLGDRYELLPIVNTAFVMSIPVIHFSGGDVTEGAIDDGIRNAVTMLSQYHFPGTNDSADNIIRMRGSNKNIWMVGEPGLDYFLYEKLMSRDEIAENLLLNPDMDWCLFTFHPETKKKLEDNLNTVRDCLDILDRQNGIQVIATYSNADFGGQQINEYIKERSSKCKGRIKVIPSLGNLRYLSLMRQVRLIVGNSSSGIIESPMIGVPVVNVGERQKGRHLCNNIIQTDTDRRNISNAICHALKNGTFEPDMYWGDGHTAKRVIAIMEKELI